MPTYFGNPSSSPFNLGGTYITPQGKQSVAGIGYGSSGKKKSSSSKSSSSKVSQAQLQQRQAELQAQAQRQAELQAQRQAQENAIKQRKVSYSKREDLNREEQVRLALQEGFITQRGNESNASFIRRLEQRGKALDKIYIIDKQTSPKESKVIKSTYRTNEGKLMTTEINVDKFLKLDLSATTRRLATKKEYDSLYPSMVQPTLITPTSKRKERIISSVPYTNIKDILGQRILPKSFVEGTAKATAEMIVPKSLGLIGKRESSKQFTTGFVEGYIPGTVGDVAIPLSIGYGVGFASKGIVKGAYSLGQVTGVTSKVGLTTAGVTLTSIYGAKKGIKIIEAPTLKEKGKIVGGTARELSLIGVGAKFGSKGYEQLSGVIQTRGRSYLETAQGEYPQAPTTKQLELFRKNVIQELGKEPGAFHTTGQKFFGKGTDIKADVGSSELQGLYASTQVSTPFARIQGSGSQAKISIFKGFFDAPNQPAIAFLKPKGFRYSPAQAYKGFKTPIKKGYADVPGIKTEIEAIFRPGETYTFESGGYYTKIKGVRVPIDVFTYKGSGVGITAPKLTGGASSYSTSISSSSISFPLSFAFVSSSTTPTTSVSSVTSISSSSSYKVPSSSIGNVKRSSSIRSVSSSVPSVTSSLNSSKSNRSSISRIHSTSRSSGSSSSYSYYPSKTTTTATITPTIRKQKKKKRTSFTVSIRRFGKFKPLGIFSSSKKAQDIGRYKTATTLGATYRIKGQGALNLRTPKGYYKKVNKDGVLFIEKRSKRLSTRGEKVEIGKYKKMKGGLIY